MTYPVPTVFISYSHKDETWKERLLPHLRALETAGIGMQVWHDRKIDGGDKWYPEIQNAMGNAAVAVLLVSADFLASPFCVQEEVPALLKRQEQHGMLLVPVLLRACMWKAHRWLSARQMIPRDGKCVTVDYAGDQADVIFATIAEQVFDYFDSKAGTAAAAEPLAPAAAIAVEPFALDFSVDMPNELDTGVAFVESRDIDFADDLADVAGAGIPWPQSKPSDFPAPAAPSFARSRVPFPASDAFDPFAEWVGKRAAPTVADPWPNLPFTRVDLTHLPTTGSALFGRDAELAQLDEAWTPAEPTDHVPLRVLAFIAHGGVGKSTLVNHWLAEMARDQYRGANHVFGWSFYSQGVRQQAAASADAFIHAALCFFGDADPSAGSPWDKGSRLARLVGSQRALLVLDGLEPLQSPHAFERGKLRDPAVDSLLRGLARQSAGLCLITSRERLPDLAGKPGVVMHDLEKISPQAGRALLRTARVVGTDAQLQALASRFGPHALSVSLLGAYLYAQPGHGVEAATQLENLPGTEPIDRVLAGFDLWLGDGPECETLRLLGLFDRPADAGCLAALRQMPAIAGLTEHLVGLDDAAWERVLARLEKLRLIQVQRDNSVPVSVDAHPLVREHFSGLLQGGEAWRAAHQRLYEHLCSTTNEGDEPTLEDLQPLYQAVAHGCRAGLEREAREMVFEGRILRGDVSYSTRKLGAAGSDLGALANFFESPWSRVATVFPRLEEAWVLALAAYNLRSLGRLAEAVEPNRAARDIFAAQGTPDSWPQAASSANNLSELELALGNLPNALSDGEQAVSFAERSCDWRARAMYRTTLAHALHQSGRWAQAQGLLAEAEVLQAEAQPKCPLLYAIQGFRYCDLLLADVERAAWRATLHVDNQPGQAKQLGAFVLRATKTFAWVSAHPDAPLLSLAFEQITSARAALYASVLQDGAIGPSLPAPEIGSNAILKANEAVSSLRHASEASLLPLGLLTRAWLCALQGHLTGPNSAQDDLDEAWDIAEHGGMVLFLADIHLHRARLFMREKDYPWNKHPDGSPRGPHDDLADARRLIERHGYWRRKQELEDAEAALACHLALGDGSLVQSRCEPI